jgi:hypothetical protein
MISHPYVTVTHLTKFSFHPSGDFVKKKLEINPDVYYSPAAPNQDGFDFFIMHQGILYLFQFTDTETYDIRDFVDFFNKCIGHPVQNHWWFIFVIPSNTHITMKCPRPVPATDVLQELALYSAEVALKSEVYILGFLVNPVAQSTCWKNHSCHIRHDKT